MKKTAFSLEYDRIHLEGYQFIPGEEKKKYATILLAHEFASNMKSTQRFAIPFCEMGYQVFIFDYAGSALTKSSGRTDREASILTEKEEFEAVYQYVKALPSTDCEHLILAGCSQGGMGAALVAGEHPEEIEKLMMFYPALCGPDYMRQGYMMGKYFDPVNPPEFLEMFHGTGIGKKFVKDFASLEPWKEITRFQGPVLICHGTEDSIADIAYAREAAGRYCQCQLMEIPGGEHIFKEKSHFQIAIKAAADFLA